MILLNIYYPTGLNNQQNILIIRWGICAVIAAELLLIVLLRLISIVKKSKVNQGSSGDDEGLPREIQSGIDLKQKPENEEGKQGEEKIRGDDVAKKEQTANKNQSILKKLRTKVKVVNLIQCREQRLARREANKRKQKQQQKQKQKQMQSQQVKQSIDDKTKIKKQTRKQSKTTKIHTIPQTKFQQQQQQSNQFNSDDQSSQQSSSSSSQSQSEPTQHPNKATTMSNSRRLHKFKKTHEKLYYPYIQINHLNLTFHDSNTAINLLFSHSFITFLALLMYYPFVVGFGVAFGHFVIVVCIVIVGLFCGNSRRRVLVMRVFVVGVFGINLGGIGLAIFGILRSNAEFFANVYQM